jgi:hypothetical protein
MPKFKVKTPVRHDGDDFAPGDTIELTKKQADVIGSDVLDPMTESAPAKANKDDEKDKGGK